MNEAATVEYLLRLYAKYAAKMKSESNWLDIGGHYSCKGKLEVIVEILQERFGMTIRETEAEYVAYNSVCEIHVGKPRPTVGGSR